MAKQGQRTKLALETINASSVEQADKTPDAKTELEENTYNVEHQRLLLKEHGQNIAERKKYAARVFWTSAGWVCAIFLILVADGLGFHFHLSDSVLLVAIGSTTTNILGVFYIVVRYLFATPQHEGVSKRHAKSTEKL